MSKSPSERGYHPIMLREPTFAKLSNLAGLYNTPSMDATVERLVAEATAAKDETLQPLDRKVIKAAIVKLTKNAELANAVLKELGI